MSRNDLYSMYNELDDMISSIDIKDEDVVKDDEVVGVGKAILTGREMEQCTNGIGVKIKHRVKNN